MVLGHCTLGIDVGDETVVAAVRRRDDDDRAGPALPVPTPPGHPLRRVGSPTPMVVDGRPVDPAAIVAALALDAAQAAAPGDGPTTDRTVLTVPPSWGEHRRDTLTAALRSAGMADFSLESSAVAVVRHHRDDDALSGGVPVVVVDVGASTVDTAVLRTTADGRIETVAVPPPPLAWGGRDLDDAVVELVRDCLADEDGPGVSPAELKRACVAAKEALSTDTVTCVELTGPDGAVSLRLVREDLDELVTEPLQALVTAVRATLTEAGVQPAELGAVVLSGGTAAVPLIAETLSAALDKPVVVDAEPALTAARGAAELAADLAGAELPEEPEDTVADPPPATSAAPSVGRRTTTRLAAAAGRPPARSGVRPPTQATGQPGRRRAARVGVVLSAFVVLVLGVAVAVSATWTGSPAEDAAADVVPPVQAGAPQSPAEVGSTVGGGLSPAASQGGTDGTDVARAGSVGTADHRGTADHPSAASTRASRSTAAGRAPTAGASTAGASSPDAPQPGRPETVSDPGSASTVPRAETVDTTSVPPAADPPVEPAPNSQPPADPGPTSEAPADPPPTSEPPADPPPATDPPADPPPAETTAPEPPPATDVPPPAETGAA